MEICPVIPFIISQNVFQDFTRVPFKYPVVNSRANYLGKFNCRIFRFILYHYFFANYFSMSNWEFEGNHKEKDSQYLPKEYSEKILNLRNFQRNYVKACYEIFE